MDAGESQVMAAVAAAQPAGAKKTATGKLPADCGGDTITVAGIGSRQQLEAYAAAAGNDLKYTHECAKRAIVKKNGEPFGLASRNEFDVWWEKIEVKGRRLVAELYQARNGVSEGELADFLKGVVIDG